jgi:hypothetical protein
MFQAKGEELMRCLLLSIVLSVCAFAQSPSDALVGALANAGRPTPEQAEQQRETNEKLARWAAERRAQKFDAMKKRVAASIQLARIHHPDFDALFAANPRLINPAPAMEQAIGEARDPGELCYFLQGHPEEYYRVAALKDKEQKREIERLDKTVERASAASSR